MTETCAWIKEGVSFPPGLRLVILSAITILFAIIPKEGMSKFGLEIYGLRMTIFVILGVAYVIAVIELLGGEKCP